MNEKTNGRKPQEGTLGGWSVEDVVEEVRKRNNEEDVIRELESRLTEIYSKHEVRVSGRMAGSTYRSTVGVPSDKTLPPDLIVKILRKEWPQDYRFRLLPEVEIFHEFEIELALDLTPSYSEWRKALLSDSSLPLHNCLCYALGHRIHLEFERYSAEPDSRDYFVLYDYITGNKNSHCEIGLGGEVRINARKFRKAAIDWDQTHLQPPFLANSIVNYYENSSSTLSASQIGGRKKNAPNRRLWREVEDVANTEIRDRKMTGKYGDGKKLLKIVHKLIVRKHDADSDWRKPKDPDSTERVLNKLRTDKKIPWYKDKNL